MKEFTITLNEEELNKIDKGEENMKNNEHCIYCEAGMPIFDDCEIGMVVYPSTVQPFNTFLRYDNSKTGEHKTVKFNVNYCPICGRKIKKEEKNNK